MRWTLAATGDADPTTVWDRYVRPSAWPDWSPQIRRVDCADPRIVEGTTGTVRTVVGLGVPFRVTALDEVGRAWSWRVELPFGQSLDLEHTVVPAGPGSRTTLDLSGSAPLVLGYLPLAQYALTRLVRS